MKLKKTGRTRYGMDIYECPVCRRSFIEQGMRNHIIGTAKGELFRYFMGTQQGETIHLEYVNSNIKMIEVRKLKLSL